MNNNYWSVGKLTLHISTFSIGCWKRESLLKWFTCLPQAVQETICRFSPPVQKQNVEDKQIFQTEMEEKFWPKILPEKCRIRGKKRRSSILRYNKTNTLICQHVKHLNNKDLTCAPSCKLFPPYTWVTITKLWAPEVISPIVDWFRSHQYSAWKSKPWLFFMHLEKFG